MEHHVYNDADVHVRSHANLVLLQRLYTRLEKRSWLKQRRKFLLNELAVHGKLVCHYCGESNLELKSDKRHVQVTVDHFVPTSKGGREDDPSNFVVCCLSCNETKAAMDAESFMNSGYLKRKKASRKKS